MKRLPLAVVGGLILIAAIIPMSGGELGFGEAPAARPSPTLPGSGAAGASAAAAGQSPDVTSGPLEPSPAVAADPPTTAPATASPVARTDVPIVPVTHFRTAKTATDRDQVAQILDGTSKRFDGLELLASDADAILAALELEVPAGSERLILADDIDALRNDLADHRLRLALIRADQVGPQVRALAWDKVAMFGTTRITDPADWPLTASVAADTVVDPPFDPTATWTMFAGGDILLDRGVYETVRVKKKGVDFLFDGGTAEITSRYCCSSFGWELPRTKRTGNAGAVRSLISGADLAIANFENPAPDKFRWHTSKTVFTADPGIIDGLAAAGLDYVGLANNHIGDAGKSGITQTIKNLDKRGLISSGAGKSEAAARKPAIIDVQGTTVAILAYDRIAKYYWASGDTGGSAGLTVKKAKADIKKARAAGADVVIVFPHWGVEYRATPSSSQRQMAHDIIDAGADMIIGNHAHWAAAMEVYQGKPIWYALGNFVFDQTWSEPTMEGITLELTFEGPELVQARMRPHIILDKAQPNFLDSAGDGKVVLSQMFKASKGLLPW